MLLKTAGSALALGLILGCATNKATTAGTLGAPAAAPVSIATMAGDYALVTVDGHALPFTLRSAAGTSARPIVAGSFALKNDGTFRLQTAYGAETAASATATGTCYTEGDEVKMVWDGGGLTNIALRGDTVVLKREGAQYGYLRKR
jgi:hypothetical protein